MSHPNPVHAHLHEKTVADIMGEQKELVTFKPKDIVEKAVRDLAEKKILSGPVVDEKEGEVVGFIDMLDVLKWIVTVTPDIETLGENELRDLKYADQAMSLATLDHIVDFSSRDPLLVVQKSQPASGLANAFAKGFHRVAVYDKETLAGICSQSDLIRYLADFIKRGTNKELAEKTLADLGFKSSEVVTVAPTLPVINVLKKIATSGVSAVAVVDEESGRLVGNFSASDTRGMFFQDLPGYKTPVADYLNDRSPDSLKPIVVESSVTLQQAIETLAENHLHRVWIIDDFKPVGVVSLTDISSIVAKYEQQ